jgi:uncharacterized protein (TIGR02757 family)
MPSRDPRLHSALEGLYNCYNNRCWVHPDPLEFLYRYDRLEDREVAALVSSMLAYGRVGTILSSVSEVLDCLGGAPARALRHLYLEELECMLAGFRHRFATGFEVARILKAYSRLQEAEGGIGSYLGGLSGSLMERLDILVGRIYDLAGIPPVHLLAVPSRGSACKRHMLMLRWMVRRDRVDPGGWQHLGRENLVVPLDTHMLRAAGLMGMTESSTACLSTARAITRGFAEIRPDDPVRFDFAITRFGIRPELTMEGLLEEIARRCAEAPACPRAEDLAGS